MAGTLTRSRIEAFDQTANQLSQYAVRWRNAGETLDHTAGLYVSQIATPSGAEWHCQAASGALEAAHTDRVAVSGAAFRGRRSSCRRGPRRRRQSSPLSRLPAIRRGSRAAAGWIS